jgi:hypothetical protein
MTTLADGLYRLPDGRYLIVTNGYWTISANN